MIAGGTVAHSDHARDIAHEVTYVALMEFGKPYGVARFSKNAPVQRQKVWKYLGIEPRAIDRKVVTIMHSTHIGCTGDIDSLIRMSLRTSLAHGWVGSMMVTRFSDILFGTP